MTSSEPRTTEINEQPTDALFKRYDALGVDDKLALLYYVYEAMGSSITPAAPEAADPELAEPLIKALYDMSEADQLEAMRAVVRGDQSDISQRYGGLSANNQLLVWYGWAEAMGDRIVDMPSDYEAKGPLSEILSDLKGMEFQSQISLLREAATQMGFSNVTAPPPLAETGVTDSL
ncbi:orange carotenoid protein N-terminal domain-containing protein [Nodosilinea sp. E11]|uniref:orange carotenoid protein N-terminal domain-containing protein n=1 Tax=Nodosilinea sp. E11 TaxID=3037479 RepID=UPI00293450A2|nr:orange carotenoid protein N-terminal domain-containing protein [Nodosilinea sp. E11]WOD39021.1 orange carotenoid protein N-terminal domain-containing protein [Nodosilinea sp. E11]